MSFASNVHISSHPVLKSKLSYLRQKISAKETRQYSDEISTILSVWVSEKVFTSSEGNSAISAAGAEFTISLTSPETYVLVPVLRSGLSMVDCKSESDMS